jgi:integrase
MMSEYAIRNGYATVNYAELIELPPMEKPSKHPFTEQEISLLWDYYEKQNDLFSASALIMIYTGMRYGEISTIHPDDIHLEDGYLTGGIKTDAGKQGEILLIPKIKPLVEQVLIPINKLSNYTAEGFRKGFNRMQADAGIPRHTVHECRHTTATLLAVNGVHPSVISEIMRHTNYSQTMEYTHVPLSVKMDSLSLLWCNDGVTVV